jgi:hypothetical protein
MLQIAELNINNLQLDARPIDAYRFFHNINSCAAISFRIVSIARPGP